MRQPRFLADEMLGRLARYLRFAGYDTEYARNCRDIELVERAASESRTLITRDRRLAAASPGALLLVSPDIEEQIRAVAKFVPGFRFQVTFDRCTSCNSPLGQWPHKNGEMLDSEVPASILRSETPLYRCERCQKWYWEGSHTRSIRARFAAWERDPG